MDVARRGAILRSAVRRVTDESACLLVGDDVAGRVAATQGAPSASPTNLVFVVGIRRVVVAVFVIGLTRPGLHRHQIVVEHSPFRVEPKHRR